MNGPVARRRVHTLGVDERNAIWECHGPVWCAFYAWFGQDAHGWHYSLPEGRLGWRPAAAGVGDVNRHSITSGTDDGPIEAFEFIEVVRFGAAPVLFTDNGLMLPLPTYLTAAQR